MIKATFENAGFVFEHRDLYLKDGQAGHDIDMSAVGGKEGGTPSLLLRTVGRKTGNVSIMPLIYGKFGEEYAIIASKGGSPEHPSWYFNMEAGGRLPFRCSMNGSKQAGAWLKEKNASGCGTAWSKSTRPIPTMRWQPIAAYPSSCSRRKVRSPHSDQRASIA